MPTKDEYGWKCSVCGEHYPRDVYAVSCEQGHEIVYVPFKQGDLLRLIQYIYTGDSTLLSDSLMKTLLKYSSFRMGGRSE